MMASASGALANSEAKSTRAEACIAALHQAISQHLCSAKALDPADVAKSCGRSGNTVHVKEFWDCWATVQENKVVLELL